jgi:GNAT superfamily N-acetyltransferase
MRIYSHFSSQHLADFCALVAQEWQEDIAALEQKFSFEIYLGIEKREVFAGLAVFTMAAPETEKYAEIAAELFSQKMAYLGYLVVVPKYRGCGIGAQFLERFLGKFPQQSFWLAIEDPKLAQFYQRHGFQLFATVAGEQIFILRRDQLVA